MAAGTDGGRSSDGVHGSILEAGLGSTGAVLEAEMPEAGRCRPSFGNVASGAGAVKSWAARTKERLPGRRTTGETAGGTRTGAQLRAGCRAAPLAHGDAWKVPVEAQSRAIAKSIRGSAGRSAYQTVQPSLRSDGSERPAHPSGVG